MRSPGDHDPRDASDTPDTADPEEAGITFQGGLALFNSGDFFACHEVWEELWLRSSGEEKLFYQGLIQAAVAILHAERGNLSGALSTWRKACAKLDPLPTHHRELRWASSVKRWRVSSLMRGRLSNSPAAPEDTAFLEGLSVAR